MTFGGGERHVAGGSARSSRTRPMPWSRRRSTPASTSSTPPTSIRKGSPSRSSARRCATSGSRRDQVVIATKVYGRMGQGPNAAGASRGHIMDAVEREPRRGSSSTISTSTRSTASTRRRRSRRRSTRSTTSSAAALVRYIGAFELAGLAGRQGARHLGAPQPRPVRLAAGLLHHRRPRPRARDRADAAVAKGSA